MIGSEAPPLFLISHDAPEPVTVYVVSSTDSHSASVGLAGSTAVAETLRRTNL